MARWIKNASGSDSTYVGQLITDGTYYQIQSTEATQWAASELLLADVASGAAVVSTTNDATGHLGVAAGLDHLAGSLRQVSVAAQPAFASSYIDNKSLFSRMRGKKFTGLSVGSNDLLYTVSYPIMKFNGLELVGCELGDYVDLYVLDSTTGTYTGTPDAVLNQFGYTVYPSADYYERHSNYDADIFVDMQIKLVYNSVSAKDLYVNYVLHELK